MFKKRISKKLRQSVQSYVDLLKIDRIPIAKVLLFGSYAKGTQNRWSDIDLCIISSKFNDPWKATQYLWRKLPQQSNFIFEPVGFSPRDFNSNSSFITQIKKTAIRII